MKFLESICTLCRQYSLLEDMDAFCHKTELAENIKVRGRVAGWGRDKAPRTPAPCEAGAGGGGDKPCTDTKLPEAGLGVLLGLQQRALGAGVCHVPSWLCSAGFAGRGAHGQFAHSIS